MCEVPTLVEVLYALARMEADWCIVARRDALVRLDVEGTRHLGILNHFFSIENIERLPTFWETFGRRTGEVFGYFVATCSLRGCWPRNWSRFLCVHLVSRTWTIRIFRLFYKCTKSHQRFFFNLSSFREKKLMILPNADGISS